MSPVVKLEAVGHEIDAGFARALPTLESLDPTHLVEEMAKCTPFAEMINLVHLTAENPLGWRYPAVIGLHHVRGASGISPPNYLGDIPDQTFACRILLPTYLDVINAAQPVVHKVTTVANNVLLSYRKLTYPIYSGRRMGDPSHILMLVHVDFAIPGITCERGSSPLSLRERECLSLTAAGLGAKQMASEIGISEKTVELHLCHARQKLGARTTAQAVAVNLALAMVDN
jgi:DNA-binding CsgD family transcriptional regulator